MPGSDTLVQMTGGKRLPSRPHTPTCRGRKHSGRSRHTWLRSCATRRRRHSSRQFFRRHVVIKYSSDNRWSCQVDSCKIKVLSLIFITHKSSDETARHLRIALGSLDGSNSTTETPLLNAASATRPRMMSSCSATHSLTSCFTASTRSVLKYFPPASDLRSL